MKLIAHHASIGEEPARTAELCAMPGSNVGFRELCAVDIEVPRGGAYELHVDDEPMPLVEGRWRWVPNFFAGEVTAELLDARKACVARYLFDVAPNPEKLGREQFQSLLKEIIDEDPALAFGAEPSQHGVGVGRNPSPQRLNVLLALARVRTHTPAFLRALREASQQPRRVIRRTRALEAPHRVRRLDTTSYRRLALQGGLDPALLETRPLLVDVPVTEPSVDSAANRALVAQGHALLHRLRWLVRELPRLAAEEESETRTALAPRTGGRLQALARLKADLQGALRAEPWCHVTSAELTAAGLTAVASDPVYARAYQQAWKALRLTLSAEERDPERLWLSPSWELFERWCFVRLARALRDELPGFSWTRIAGSAHPSGAEVAWRGERGDAIVTLLLQPEFRAHGSASRWELQSISRLRFPDVMLSWETNTARGYMLLDAKYRVSRQGVLEAMDSAHIYRDSMRWHGSRPELALLLLPAATEAKWLCEATFHRREMVGACAFLGEMPEVVREAVVHGLSVGR